MAVGARHYGEIREKCRGLAGPGEINETRIDDDQRLLGRMQAAVCQIARTLVTGPRLVFKDEPTGGLESAGAGAGFSGPESGAGGGGWGFPACVVTP